MARGFFNAQLSERECAITRCEIEDVSPEELRILLLRLQRLRCPLETLGAVRIHYDHLIDDAEKAVRQHLGMETDYSHKFSDCVARPGKNLAGKIDEIPMNTWCLLYLPEKAAKDKRGVTVAIKWCIQNGHPAEATRLEQMYADIVFPKKEGPKLSLYELRLLNDDDYLPDNASNVKQAIARLRKRGFEAQAIAIDKKYSWLIYNDVPPDDLISAEEADAMLAELMKF